MKQWLVVAIGAFVGIGMVVDSAEAKRLGGGKSLGSQRQITPQKTAPQNDAAAPRSPSAPAATPRGVPRWMAPLAGLAVGLGLAALFGEQLGSFILLALIVLAVVLVLRMLLRGRPVRQRSMQTPQGAHYQAYGRETEIAPPPSQATPPEAARPELPRHFTAAIPADFDVDGFIAQAKRNFLALQAANDRGDLQSLREMMSDELYENIRQDIEARAGAAQQTDVVTLDAQLLEVLTEKDMHWASIRFSGMLREEVNDSATRFEEIWNLQKPAQGASGWLLAGVQQVA